MAGDTDRVQNTIRRRLGRIFCRAFENLVSHWIAIFLTVVAGSVALYLWPFIAQSTVNLINPMITRCGFVLTFKEDCPLEWNNSELPAGVKLIGINLCVTPEQERRPEPEPKPKMKPEPIAPVGSFYRCGREPNGFFSKIPCGDLELFRHRIE